ncbi:MAG: OmpH family outer membrane protein [Deltaproteobacteria bacterium]|nr:OmpH family outer membrane protein [Deltaproteobacteria bacterium]
MLTPRKRHAALAAAICLAVIWSAPLALAEGDKLVVATVDMNKAINESKKGKRSKDKLTASKDAKEKTLKKEEEQLRALDQEIQTNMMLSKSARDQKIQDLQNRQQALRQNVQKAQMALMQEERQATEELFNEIKRSVRKIASKRKVDIVLEKGASQIILYSNFEFIDITDDVIIDFDG